MIRRSWRTRPTPRSLHHDQPLREIESIFVIFDCPKSEIVHPLMLLNVNTLANDVIEISFALMKFMEVLMDVYLPYSFNC